MKGYDAALVWIFSKAIVGFCQLLVSRQPNKAAIYCSDREFVKSSSN